MLGFPPVMPSVFIDWVKQISWVDGFNHLSLLSLIFYFCANLCLCATSSLFLFFQSFIPDTYSQSAAIQLRENPHGKDHRAEGLLLNLPDSPIPRNRDAPRTPPPLARKQPRNREHQQGQPDSDSMSGPSKLSVEGLEDDIVRVGTGISKVAGQGNEVEVPSYYRPTRRGSPRPSTHNHFDINEHLPWMIVLLLLLVLVVIVVCSVKRSSRVLKKGPMQDPSSIMEKAIQKKPSAPPTQVKEKWIYYSNGQGKCAFLFCFFLQISIGEALIKESGGLFWCSNWWQIKWK